jgi:Pyruvate/2-oxoacid:ferredoxin oxidoreductase delta subunit
MFNTVSSSGTPEKDDSKTKTRRKFRSVIDSGSCKGCLLCCYACSKLGGDMLGESGETTAIGGVLPEVMGECIGCRWCERFCPDFAISVEEVVA